MIKNISLAMIILFGLSSPGLSGTEQDASKTLDTAIFASGCFWCTEAIFEEVAGVKEVTSGYTGGHIKNPAYREVTEGTTGHAEAVRIIYDPEVIKYKDLLEIFFKTHDPTTLNRQGADVGTQYRSAIFYLNEEQRKQAEETIELLDKSAAWDNPIVTELTPASTFYEAEEYHQDYYKKNPYASYCSFVIGPKMKKFKKVFPDKLKQ